VFFHNVEIKFKHIVTVLVSYLPKNITQKVMIIGPYFEGKNQVEKHRMGQLYEEIL
jgi:stress-induced morphogen